jgi:hypothetical protein
MKTSATLLYLSSLLSTTLALPSTIPTARSPVGTEWSVYNYTEGRSPGGCVYGFNIAGGSSPTNEPDFATYCSGTDVANKLQSCQDPAISSNEIPGTGNVTLVVQHKYTTENGATYWVTGNTTVIDGDGQYPKTFGIKQSEIMAVL